MSVDGRNPHPLALDLPGASDYGYGRWTSDGRHFIFQAIVNGSSNVYELIEPNPLRFWERPRGVRLTSGELEVLDAIPSRDNKQVFVLGRISQGVMEVYDSREKRFVPFLGGLAATEVVISPDRRWMAFTEYPSHFLWRSRLDGAERVQLTNSYADWPRWSPDGKRIVYMDWRGNRRGIYVIPSDGGTPERLIGGDEVSKVAPEWTPDGRAITFNDFPKLGTELKGIQVLDLASHRVSVIPGSKGYYVGSWSPDGKHMVAVAQNPLRMMILDVRSGSWSELMRFEAPWGYWVWTRDSRSILFAQTERDRGIYRLAIGGGKWERIAALDGINVTDQYQSFISLTADGQPAIMNDTSVAQIYSLTWRQ